MSDLEKILDPIFQGQVDKGNIAGAAAVAYDVSGDVLFSKGYGHRTGGDSTSPAITPQTPAMIWSCTKLVVCVAGLQLVEQGKLNLHDPVEKYLPQIKEIQRLHGFDSEGKPQLAPPKTPIKVLHLFTHTSGFTYDFFNPETLKWREAKGQPPCAYVTRSAMDEYTAPLVFEPGERWEYGTNQEWIGFLIEKISGLPLAEYVDRNIVKPLGLKVTGKGLTPEQDEKFFSIHVKAGPGQVSATELRMAVDPEVVPGGHYLYSTTEEYAAFLLALLNNGVHPKSNVRILKEETVKKYLFKDMLPEVGCSGKGVADVPSTMPPITRTGSFMPGIDKGWSCGGLINNESLPNGRNKNSLAWAGLGNCYFWVDPTAGKLGFVVSASLPFFDEDVLHLADALERAVYGKPAAKEIGEKGSNFSGGGL